jgi:hypothetical protein
MSRRDEWRRVLEAEVAKWAAKSCAELIAELADDLVYEVEVDSKKYQVEVEILENNDRFVQIVVAVDDGVLPWAIAPAARSIVCNKTLADSQ